MRASAVTAALRRSSRLKEREAMTGAAERMVKTRHGNIAVADTGGHFDIGYIQQCLNASL